MGIRMETKSFKKPRSWPSKCKFHRQTCKHFESWTNVQDIFSFSTKSCNYSHLQESCFIFPLVIILLTISSTKKNLHFVSITIIVFLHTFFGLAQFFKKPCNPVFNVLQFFKKKSEEPSLHYLSGYISGLITDAGFVTFSHNHPNTGMNVLTHLFRVSKAMDELGRLRWKWRYLYFGDGCLDG